MGRLFSLCYTVGQGFHFKRLLVLRDRHLLDAQPAQRSGHGHRRVRLAVNDENLARLLSSKRTMDASGLKASRLKAHAFVSLCRLPEFRLAYPANKLTLYTAACYNGAS